MYGDTTTFPMMGVGVFNIMFWVGFVAGHNVGLACDGMLLTALFSGGLGSYAVSRLERAFRGEVRARAHTETEQETKRAERQERSAEPVFEA